MWRSLVAHLTEGQAAAVVVRCHIGICQTGSMPQWKDYQEQSATLVRQFGFNAETDVVVKGSQASHDVDGLVTYSHAGLDLMWIVE